MMASHVGYEPARKRVNAGAEVQRVIHLVGRLTEPVMGQLGPLTEVLAQRGVPQTVVMLQGSESAIYTSRFHLSVEIKGVLTGQGPIVRWSRLRQAFRTQLAGQPVLAVHLHGFVPCLLGVFGSARLIRDAAVYFSPHGSKAIYAKHRLFKSLLRYFNPLSGRISQKTVAGVAHEARYLAGLAVEPVAVLESPVDPAFTSIWRHETANPLVIASGLEPNWKTASLIARIAVLTREDPHKLSFVWYGPVDSETSGALQAADVNYLDPVKPVDRAAGFCGAWVFITGGEGRGFPHRLAEAMSMGIPCVALDSEASRDLLRDGETGFICRREDALIKRLAQLIDSKELRKRIGAAARRESRLRFSDAVFRSALLGVYQLERRRAPRDEVSSCSSTDE